MSSLLGWLNQYLALGCGFLEALDQRLDLLGGIFSVHDLSLVLGGDRR